MSSRFPSFLAAVLLLAPAPAQARELRVCADPNNLPYSARDGSGFENRIASVLAEELRADLRYVWAPQWRGFLRKTLNAGLCDLVVGVPVGLERVRTTRPYYTSTYVFVQRGDAVPIASFADPALRSVRIGVHLIGDDGANTPPVEELAKRGIVAGVHGYMVYGDIAEPFPLAPIIAAVGNGDIDVAIVWGPSAAFFAARQQPVLRATPVADHDTAVPMAFAFAMGVRQGDDGLAAEVDRAIAARRSEIDAILDAYHVPRPAPSPALTTIGVEP